MVLRRRRLAPTSTPAVLQRVPFHSYRTGNAQRSTRWKLEVPVLRARGLLLPLFTEPPRVRGSVKLGFSG
jgi:hypothetical protein